MLVGIIIVTPKANIFKRAIRLGFKAFNNELEYVTLINGLKMALSLGIRKVRVFSNS